MSCSEARVKLYDLLVDGYHTPRSDDDIMDLYRAGRLRRNDPCRVTGTKPWKTVDELFPLLKYDSSSLSSSRSPRRTSSPVLDGGDSGAAREARTTSALKAGWICFGLGLAISWFFPLGNAFFSVALILAVVAMCTHQVNRGLALLISSFCGIVFCAVMFFGLALGTVALTGAAAMQKADADLKRMHAEQQRALNQLTPSVQQLQAARLNLPLPSAIVRNVTVQHPTPSQLVNAPPEDRTKRDTVRRAEMERDRINAKEQRIQQLQKSIDWQDEQIRNIRQRGGDESFFVKQRDALLAEKWNLQR
jgi:hypothetical protein